MPANCSWVEEDIRAFKSSEARAFRIPLVPTDERADLAEGRVEGFKSEVAGSEIKLFVVKRIVRNMHLPVNAFQSPVRIEHGSGVVIEAACAFLKDRRNDYNFGFSGDVSDCLRCRAGNRLGEIEQRSVFALTEILRAEQLRQAYDLRAQFCGLAYFRAGTGEVVVRIWRTAHLNQANAVMVLFTQFNLPLRGNGYSG